MRLQRTNPGGHSTDHVQTLPEHENDSCGCHGKLLKFHIPLKLNNLPTSDVVGYNSTIPLVSTLLQMKNITYPTIYPASYSHFVKRVKGCLYLLQYAHRRAIHAWRSIHGHGYNTALLQCGQISLESLEGIFEVV